MSLAQALNSLTSNAALVTPSMMASIDVALLRAAQVRGAFPTSLKLLENLRTLIDSGQADANTVAAQVSADPILTLRVLCIANHEYYRREAESLTVADAIRTVGLKKIGNVVSDLSEAKNFNAIYLGRAVAVTMMQQAIVATVLARRLIASRSQEPLHEGITTVAAALTNAGPLLLAYFYPHIYSGLCLDCMDDRQKFERAFQRIMRKSIGEFGAALTRVLSLPALFTDLLQYTDAAPWDASQPPGLKEQPWYQPACAVRAANLLAHELCYFTGVQGVQALIRELDQDSPFQESVLEDAVGATAEEYFRHTATLELKPFRLPDYLSWFASTGKTAAKTSPEESLPAINTRINPFLYELRACFKTRVREGEFYRLPQAVHCTLHALIKGLNFDRAVLFRVDEKSGGLKLALCLGMKLFKPDQVQRSIQTPAAARMPDIVAMLQRKLVVGGEPVFPDGWPFVSFPAIWRDKVIAVFYADKIRRPESDILDTREQIACTALAEEWQDIAADFC